MADSVMGLEGFGQGQSAPALPPPEVTSGGIRPLLEGTTARPLRYRPVDGEFVIRNGREFFNRPLYSTTAFRVDAGDLPEFSLYLPGHGGNLKLGFIAFHGTKWAAQADEVVARYRPGRMTYEIKDGLLGSGLLKLVVLTGGEGPGLLLRAEGQRIPKGVTLAWAFGGASGRKGRRGGDIGCEVEPVAQFFQVRAEECEENHYAASMLSSSAKLTSRAGTMSLRFPEGSKLAVQDFAAWELPPSSHAVPMDLETKRPILFGSVEIADVPLYLNVQVEKADGPTQLWEAHEAQFLRRSEQIEAIARSVVFDTPDAYINAVAPALAVAAEAIWDPAQGCVMHGAVAWRSALVGWRGPYVLDALGNHERTQTNVRHWIARQNKTPVAAGDPDSGPFDAGKRMSRKEGLLHSNGDLSNNHYDMNLVFFDGWLRHLRWTGDLTFAREVWPAYQRHLAWERRMFRRTFTGRDGKTLPLYEAYAAIWASDNLQYSGGGAAHSSAYNAFSFRRAAELARLLAEDAKPYEAEAESIEAAMQELLWVRERGAMAEARDLMLPQTVYDNAALWTVYHTIDSEVVGPREAWQMVCERLYSLRHVPVYGEGVPEGGYMLSCSDWLPYMWSLNLLLLAENAHMALAMWQAGMRDEAFRLLKGNLLDSMYRGLCPGDFHMTSDLDAHRQEAQRDFGDPIGITSRALIEGLFGVRPNLLRGEIVVQPGFPSEWEKASLRHKDFDLAWHRGGVRESYEFASHRLLTATIKFVVPARTTRLPKITVGGDEVNGGAFDTGAVGSPMLVVALDLPLAGPLVLEWSGDAPIKTPEHRVYEQAETLQLPPHVSLEQIDDPQRCLAAGCVHSPGVHTVFARMQSGDCKWSLPISFTVKPRAANFVAVPALSRDRHAEPVDLSLALQHRVTEIFTRGYREPRSPFCSLAIPDTLLGGWANIGEPIPIDDAGLRHANGILKTGIGVPFQTPQGSEPNCVFLSWFRLDSTSVSVPLQGAAAGMYLLVTGTTLPQTSRMNHATLTVRYGDGSTSRMELRNPETWWPIEQDYMIDDYLFCCEAPLPPRVDLATGKTRLLERESFKGKGRNVPGGAATILYLPLDPKKNLAEMKLQVELYGVVVALLGATLVRG